MSSKIFNLIQSKLQEYGLTFESKDFQSELTEEMINIYGAIIGELKDGFQLSDLIDIGSIAVPEIMKIADKMEGATGAQKKEFVVRCVWILYTIVDKGIEGDKNRINIPWVIDPIERKIEEFCIKIAIPFAIESVYNALRKEAEG